MNFAISIVDTFRLRFSRDTFIVRTEKYRGFLQDFC